MNMYIVKVENTFDSIVDIGEGLDVHIANMPARQEQDLDGRRGSNSNRKIATMTTKCSSVFRYITYSSTLVQFHGVVQISNYEI